MRKYFLLASLIAGVLATVNFAHQGQSQAEPIAGFIEEIRGVAYLKKGAQRLKLDQKKDVRRALHPGEVLSCDPGGYLRLALCGQPADKSCQSREVTASGRFRIPPLAPPQSDAERNRQQALQSLGRSGGREMGVLSPVYSPASQGMVRPGTLVLRWVSSEALSSLSLTVKETSGRELWQQNIADGAAGFLVSESLRQTLSQYRAKGGKGALVLDVEDKNHIGSQIRFSLITVEDESNLDKELSEWDKEPDAFMRRLGRAAAFSSRSMFNDVAEEFEAALAETPDSHEVLLRTMQAHRDTGNTARVEFLKRRL
jgi:hypothetical protein